MNPIALKINGIQLTLMSVEKNKTYSCKCEADGHYGCKLKKLLSLNQSKTTLTATEVFFNVQNPTGESWKIPVNPWELIDTDGFAYHPHVLCDAVRPPRTMLPGSWHVTSGTQVNFILVFSELEKGKEIARILYIENTSPRVFEINPLKPEALQALQVRAESAKDKLVTNDLVLSQLSGYVDRLDLLIYSRLNNVLNAKESTQLENQIRQQSFYIKQQFRSVNENRRKTLEGRFTKMMALYATELEAIKSSELERRTLDTKVERLAELSPREFEEYVEELFKAMGYLRVTLTSLSNDKGVDILAESHGTRIAVQCKRYKSVVGSPEIQSFLGAMTNAGAQKGFFVTTSVFSIEAERFASDHPIELIDGSALAGLIQKTLTKAKPLPNEAQPPLSLGL
jgi:restriction system protein